MTGPGPMLTGAITALVTPMTADGEFDERAFRRLLEFQCASGIDGLLPCGTTGESPTISANERDRLLAASDRKSTRLNSSHT